LLSSSALRLLKYWLIAFSGLPLMIRALNAFTFEVTAAKLSTPISMLAILFLSAFLFSISFS